jgi:hypothetical protein
MKYSPCDNRDCEFFYLRDDDSFPILLHPIDNCWWRCFHCHRFHETAKIDMHEPRTDTKRKGLWK